MTLPRCARARGGRVPVLPFCLWFCLFGLGPGRTRAPADQLPPDNCAIMRPTERAVNSKLFKSIEQRGNEPATDLKSVRAPGSASSRRPSRPRRSIPPWQRKQRAGASQSTASALRHKSLRNAGAADQLGSAAWWPLPERPVPREAGRRQAAGLSARDMLYYYLTLAKKLRASVRGRKTPGQATGASPGGSAPLKSCHSHVPRRRSKTAVTR